MEIQGFHQFTLPMAHLFEPLSASVDFEEVGKGRRGIHLVDMHQGKIPIVRTTTNYSKPATSFSTIHHHLVENLKREATKREGLQNKPFHFNNALMEVYDSTYTKMNYHSDQALDLESDSHIALFSCYERPEDLSENTLRKLKVKSKTHEEEFEFALAHHSVILFSLATNAAFQHKIVLEPMHGAKPTHGDNKWLGLTFRQSKTLIHFQNDLPYFANGALLHLADDVQRKEFFTLRGQENNSTHFAYPNITYTLSVSDTLLPKQL